MEEKIVFESNDEILVAQVCDILNEKKIPFIRKDEGSSSYINKVWGASFGVKQIYVSSEDYDKAVKLVDKFSKNVNEKIKDMPEELKENSKTKKEDEEIQEEIRKSRNARRIMFAYVPLIMVMILLLALIFAD